MKKLEAVTNVAVIIVAILSAVSLTKYLRSENTGRRAEPGITVGESIPLQGIDWRTSNGTLIMALATTCHFCTDSAPFYRRLTTELSSRGVRTIAVLPQIPADANEYLAKLDVHVTDVRQESFRDLNVRGTPTLIFVDPTGVVRRVWVGRLGPQEEERLMNAMPRGNRGVNDR